MNYSILIPANTTIKNAIRQSYDIGRSVVNKMTVTIPDGHKYLAFVRVLSKGVVLIPEFGSGDQWLNGNNNKVEVIPAPALRLAGPPFEITLIGYNTDDTYQHGFYLEIT